MTQDRTVIAPPLENHLPSRIIFLLNRVIIIESYTYHLLE